MTRIDFHILNQNKKEACYYYLARLVEKAYLLKNHIFIYTASETESKEIDEILWTFRDTSFLPHHIYDTDALTAPILISHTQITENKDVLINLNSSVPNTFLEYKRIIELVYEEETVKKIGRDKYRVYQMRGGDLHTFHAEVKIEK